MALLPAGAASLWMRRLGRLLTVVALVAFAGLVVVELQMGFDRRRAELAEAEPVAEDAEEVLSRGIEVTAWDAQGRLIEIEAEEALGPSRGEQRFRGVSVRLPGLYGEAETRIAADELVLNTRNESLEFLGNALLVTEGLEVGSDSLRFRPAPDRFWSNDTTQFVTDDYYGIAGRFRFEIEFGTVVLREVVAEPIVAGGPGLAGTQIVIEGDTGDIRVGGQPELRSERLVLTSRDPIVLRRDLTLGQTRSVEAGFGTVIHIFEAADGAPAHAAEAGEAATEGGTPDEPAAVVEEEDREADELADDPEPAFEIRGDEVVIELDGLRRPSAVRVWSGALFSGDGAELRARQGAIEFDPGGEPVRLVLSEDARGRLPVGTEGQRVVRVTADRIEVGFREYATLGETRLDGAVEATYRRAVARGGEVTFDGEESMVFLGQPRVEDSSLLEIDGARIRFFLEGAGRVEVEGGASARFLPDQLGWLPGDAASAGVTSETAVLEAGAGKGTFHGDVRLLFGENVLSAGALAVDAPARSLLASEEVLSSFAFRRPRPEPEGDPDAPPAVREDGSTTPEEKVRFEGRAARLSYDGDSGRLAYEGSPEIDHHAAAGITRLRGQRLIGQLRPDGALEAVAGELGARFERGGERVRGTRIRYRPATDELVAWGMPARADLGGERTEAGRLELDLAADRSDLHASSSGRVFARVDLAGRESSTESAEADAEDGSERGSVPRPRRRPR